MARKPKVQGRLKRAKRLWEEDYTKIPKVSNLYEAYAKVYAQDTLGVDVESLEESHGPDISVRSLYTKTYAKHGGTNAQSENASEIAYAAVRKKFGKEAEQHLRLYHDENENSLKEMIKLPPKEGTAEWHREQSRKPPGGYVGGKDPRIKDREWHRDEAERLEIEARRNRGYEDVHKRPFDHIMNSLKEENWDDDRQMMRDIRRSQMSQKDIVDSEYAKADAAFKAYNELKARPSHTRKSKEAMDYFSQKYMHHHHRAQVEASKLHPSTYNPYPNGPFEGENR